MDLIVDLGAEEPDGGFRDMETGKLNDMSIARLVLDRPSNGAFTFNFVLTSQVTNQHLAGLVCIWLKVILVWSDAYRGARVDNEGNGGRNGVERKSSEHMNTTVPPCDCSTCTRLREVDRYFGFRDTEHVICEEDSSCDGRIEG
jgi:hypothetical protein